MNFGNTRQGRRLRNFYNAASQRIGNAIRRLFGRNGNSRNSQQNRLASYYGRGSGLSNGG